MKRLLRLFAGAALLLALLLLPACSGGGEGDETTASQTEPPAQTEFLLAEGSDCRYNIVRTYDDDVKGYQIFNDAALLLRQRIRDEFGLLLPLVDDYVSKSYNDRTDREIIIGTVAGFGEEYTYDPEALGTYGYSITVQDEKIIIAANSTVGFNAAIDAFLAQAMSKQGDNLMATVKAPIAMGSDEVYSLLTAGGKRFEIAEKEGLFGICYSMWFDYMVGVDSEGNSRYETLGRPNVEEILAGKGDWLPVTAFHYWGKPAQGYYASSDAKAAANNMKLLGEAGVDFVILDYTYIQDFDTPGSDRWNTMIINTVPVLLDAVKARLENGEPSPRVVFWTADRSQWDNLYEYFYSKEEWADCFVYWNGKPFIMEWTFQGDNHPIFTVRGQNGLIRNTQKSGQWSFLEVNNDSTINKGIDILGNKIVEHMPVCVATQETYMSEPTAHGRNHGIFWYTQWVKAFENKPKIITLTWWNEWGAQRFEEGGKSLFVDNYNMEYSRDIEPMEGGHGDQYYKWMIEYIRAYRAGEECPVLVEEGWEDAAAQAVK